MGIAESLTARRFFVTGGTGFLGTALIERILRTIPDAEVTALVRPGRRNEAGDRVARDVVRNDCFARLRAELGGGFDAGSAAGCTRWPATSRLTGSASTRRAGPPWSRATS